MIWPNSTLFLTDEFEANSSIPLSDLKRTLLQTGMIHHLTMMQGLGLVRGDKEKEARIEALIKNVASDTLLWDVLMMIEVILARPRGGWSGRINRFKGVKLREFMRFFYL